MFRTLFRPSARLPRTIEEELHSLCHAAQVEALSPHLRRDIGVDCGCDMPVPSRRAPRLP